MKKALLATVFAVVFSLFASVGVAFAATPGVHAYTKDGFVIENIKISKTVETDQITLVAPAVDGKMFKGWYQSLKGEDMPDFENTDPSEMNRTYVVEPAYYNQVKEFYAVYADRYKITVKCRTTKGTKLKSSHAGVVFASRGETKSSTYIESGVTYELVAHPIKGYVFKGWYQASTKSSKGYGTKCFGTDTFLLLDATHDANMVAVYKKAKVGTTFKLDGSTYVITSMKYHKIKLKKAVTGVRTFVLPSKIKVAGYSFKVKGIKPYAFKGTSTKQISVRTKYLTKKGVKNSLKDSRVDAIIVQIFKSEVKNYPYGLNGKYGNYFTYSNCGRSVGIWCEGRP